MKVTAYAQFIKLDEYNGTPQMVFCDPDKTMWNSFYNLGCF